MPYAKTSLLLCYTQVYPLVVGDKSDFLFIDAFVELHQNKSEIMPTDLVFYLFFEDVNCWKCAKMLTG